MEKSELVSQIRQTDQEAYNRWLREGRVGSGLALPLGVARFPMLPERLLWLVQDPGNITLEIVLAEEIHFVCNVVDQSLPKPPPHLLEIGLQERQTEDGKLLYIEDYFDDPNIRRRGVATSFFAQLRAFAADLGYFATTATNNDSNLSFFTNKLKRLTLRQIRPELRHRICHWFPLDVYFDIFTVDFLDPKVAEQFILT